MNSEITDIQLEKLEGFIGYGRADAKIIFIGIEEGGGGFDNLKRRINEENYVYLDCKEFHLKDDDKHLSNEKKHKLHSNDENAAVKFQSVWRFMSYLMLRLEGVEVERIMANNKQLLREYQNNSLGTVNENGKTLLTELYPIPCKSFNTWGKDNDSYTQIIPQYKSKEEYKRSVLPKRKKLFEDLIKSDSFSASAIICYGKGNWMEFEKFFTLFGVQFENINTSKECKMGLLNNNVKVFLTPFFGNGQMNYETLEEIRTEILREK